MQYQLKNAPPMISAGQSVWIGFALVSDSRNQAFFAECDTRIAESNPSGPSFSQTILPSTNSVPPVWLAQLFQEGF
jgi:hypothetical protein